MGERGMILYHSCSAGRKCFAFLEGGGWIFKLHLHALNLCGCNSSPHEWFLTLKLIDVVPLRGWFGILYFNEVKKTWKFEFPSQWQYHLTLSCSREVFPLLQSQQFYIQMAPCLAEIGSPRVTSYSITVVSNTHFPMFPPLQQSFAETQEVQPEDRGKDAVSSSNPWWRLAALLPTCW